MYAFKKEMRIHDLLIAYKVKNTFWNTSYSYPNFSPYIYLKSCAKAMANLLYLPLGLPILFH